MALMLALGRRLPEARDNQDKRIWRGMIGDLSQREDELGGKTLLVVGLGRHRRTTGPAGQGLRYARRRAAAPPGFRPRCCGCGARHGRVRLAVADADFVALTCPLTPETENLVDAEALGWMKPTAHLVNVARGRVVDEAALIEALATRRIAGAGIDVTVEEPLAPSSPLWAMEHVLITPHTAGETRRYEDNVIEILRDNLGRLSRGEEQLRNQIV